MHAEFTAVFQKVTGGYVAFVEELPGANTQGATLENLQKAARMVLETYRELAAEKVEGLAVIREPLTVSELKPR